MDDCGRQITAGRGVVDHRCGYEYEYEYGYRTEYWSLAGGSRRDAGQNSKRGQN